MNYVIMEVYPQRSSTFHDVNPFQSGTSHFPKQPAIPLRPGISYFSSPHIGLLSIIIIHNEFMAFIVSIKQLHIASRFASHIASKAHQLQGVCSQGMVSQRHHLLHIKLTHPQNEYYTHQPEGVEVHRRVILDHRRTAARGTPFKLTSSLVISTHIISHQEEFKMIYYFKELFTPTITDCKLCNKFNCYMKYFYSIKRLLHVKEI